MSKRTTLFVVMTFWVVFVTSEWRLSAQTDADWDWTNEHFGLVLNALMPLEKTGGFYVAYRAHRDYRTDVPEYWFMIERDVNEHRTGSQDYLSAHVRFAETVSIYDQLMKMHRTEPQHDVSAMQNRISIKSIVLTEKECSAIKDQVDKLEKLRANLPKLQSDTIVIHPMNHEFHFQGAEGDVNAVLIDDEHPLVKWALETRHALDLCSVGR
jgi:hypothetical protein